MQNLSFIDTLTNEVLTEMLELISLEYDNFDELFEELLSEELILSEAIDSVQIKKEQRERTQRLRSAAKKGMRLRARQQTAQATERVNKGIKGKYDRRPWYKKAFSKLKKWVGKGVQALKDKTKPKNKEGDTEVVYTTAPVANIRTTTSNTTTSTSKPQEPPKPPKTDTQKRAETLRNKRQTTETKKQNNFNSFRKKAQEAKFKRMARPLSPAAVIAKKNPPAQSTSTTQPTTKKPSPLENQPKKKAIPTPTFAAGKQRKTRLNITNNQGQSTTMRP